MLTLDIDVFSEHEDALSSDMLISHKGMLSLHYSFRALGSSISNLEVAHEWLNLSYIYDSLRKYAVESSWCREDGIDMFFTVPQSEASDFVQALRQAAYYLEFGYNDNSPKYFSNIEQYRSDDPQMMESFFANYVSRGVYEEPGTMNIDEEDYLDKVFSQHPEWRYGLWQCHKQGIEESEVLYSQFCWVINSSKRDKVFEILYGYKPVFHLCA